MTLNGEFNLEPDTNSKCKRINTHIFLLYRHLARVFLLRRKNYINTSFKYLKSLLYNFNKLLIKTISINKSILLYICRLLACIILFSLRRSNIRTRILSLLGFFLKKNLNYLFSSNLALLMTILIHILFWILIIYLALRSALQQIFSGELFIILQIYSFYALTLVLTFIHWIAIKERALHVMHRC